MLSNDERLYVIDWELLDFNNIGDPWTEINYHISSPYSIGVVCGYFDGEPLTEFWQLQALYTSVGALTSIPWAFYRHPDELDSRINLNKMVLTWYKNMKNPVPSWYNLSIGG